MARGRRGRATKRAAVQRDIERAAEQRQDAWRGSAFDHGAEGATYSLGHQLDRLWDRRRRLG